MSFLRRFGLALFLSLCPFAWAQTPTDISAQLTFTTIDVPGAGACSVNGINLAGDMVGSYGTTHSQPPHSFLLRDGTFALFDYPGAVSTTAVHINDSGLIVGEAEFRGGSVIRGFLYDGTTFTPINMKGNTATVTWGINNGGGTL